MQTQGIFTHQRAIHRHAGLQLEQVEAPLWGCSLHMVAALQALGLQGRSFPGVACQSFYRVPLFQQSGGSNTANAPRDSA